MEESTKMDKLTIIKMEKDYVKVFHISEKVKKHNLNSSQKNMQIIKTRKYQTSVQ